MLHKTFIRSDIKRTGFFEELEKSQAKEFFRMKQKKVLPQIDNLYYSVFIAGDTKGDVYDDNAYSSTLWNLNPLFTQMTEAKKRANETNEPVSFSHGLNLDLKSYKRYNMCLSQTDLYDIFFIQSLPNEETPRIVVQLRALGLWTRGVDNILIESYQKVEELLRAYGLKIEKCRENRIDYCYHTNIISSPNKAFKEIGGKMKNLHTNLKDFYLHGDIEHAADGTIVHKDYVCFGSKKSNSVRARVYDKVKEVIEMGYKSFFFELWREKGLISFYDQFCMEYAFLHKNMDYLSKARLEFYVQFGSDEARIKQYEKELENPNNSLVDFKRIADEFMPKTTAVINIEYETKRKFYYYSDDFIENLKIDWTREETVPAPLKRIYRILDNKQIFHNHLVSKTLSFYKGAFADEKTDWLPWWARIVNVKLDGVETDEKLLRKYSQKMDKQAVQKRAIIAVASAAVYDDKTDTGFVEDMSDFLADISDNDVHKMGLRFINKKGEEIHDVYGKLVKGYLIIKAKKEIQLKNRKKKREESA